MVPDLVRRLREGDRRALARLLSLIEGGGEEAARALSALHPYTGHAYVVGVTGPPGAGKSTLVDRLTSLCRERGWTVGILGVDPTSPLTGGAFLGDRVRMHQHFLDPGVFIRSMATRGGVGGLPRMARGAVKVLDASGRDLIFVETVGVGQTEVEVMRVADTVVVVLVPETGDIIQALKAGLLEVADLFVVNKADREGAARLAGDLEAMLNMAERPPWWRPPVLQTCAPTGEGVEALFEALLRHRSALESSSRLEGKRRERRRREFLSAVEEGVGEVLRRLASSGGALARALERVEAGEEDPYTAARRLLADGSFLRSWLASLGEGP